MTLSLERARTRTPVTWLTIIGVILLPVLIGGILVAALYNPTERLNEMTAAVVNADEPVTIDGQYTPLGRQLTAGLVEGSDQIPSNLTWVISNDEDAAAGLADGRYQAVVTIPKNFSAAATSSGQQLQGSGTAQQALIQVSTPPDAKIVDDAITSQITQAAASILGRTLSSATLENVFVGFTTLGDQLGTAADGAAQLADGARQSSDGATQLAGGANDIADGVDQLASGAGGIASGASGIATGATQLSSGATQLSGGLDATASGLDRLAAGATASANGARQIADGVSQLPSVPPEVVEAANGLAANSGEISRRATDAAAQLSQLAATCTQQGGSAELCDGVAAASQRADEALPVVTDALSQSGQLADGVSKLATFGPTLTAGLTGLADGIDELATGATQSADGVAQLAAGADGLAAGASQLSDGAAQLSGGASQLAAGATTAADGTRQWSAGATALGDGVSQLADGSSTLADGLRQASDALPSLSDGGAQNLADVVADPVAAEGAGTSLFGAAAVPLLAVLALWVGGLATYVALQAVSRRALTSRRSSAMLALGGFAPGAVIGAVQGLLVAGAVQLAASYSWSDWFAFAGLCVIAGVTFAAVNQALVAALRGIGRWIGALVTVFAIATGVISTVPAWLTSVAGLMPTAPAYQAFIGVLTGAGGVGAGVTGMIVWAVLSFAVTVIVVARKRSVAARAFVAASTLPA
ncbi:YhgE/Pip domain-containing protein [Microbacterium sp. 1P10UB]|uniref:YhgE/Pip family protein n=1 Tax=unclassified Microbacterium TaxID=2609290 RepID=UPI0039A09E5A